MGFVSLTMAVAEFWLTCSKIFQRQPPACRLWSGSGEPPGLPLAALLTEILAPGFEFQAFEYAGAQGPDQQRDIRST